MIITYSQISRWLLVFAFNLSFLLLVTVVNAQPESEQEVKDSAETEELASEPPKESPWVLAPTISSDPKLATTIGAIVGYLYQFDEESTESIFLTMANYSTTDSWTAGGFGQMFFDKDKQKLIVGMFGGKIRNDYQDFLGSGIDAQTTDNLHVIFTRYSHRIKGDWYAGVQFISTNYAIGADGLFDDFLQLIGLTGFDSNGLGLVAEYDSRDNVRNPTSGRLFDLNNVAYREGLGGNEDFDVYNMKYSQYISHGDRNVLAWQVKGRWSSDAPIGGYSSVDLRGYIRGNYLAPNATLAQLDERIMLSKSWGMSVFGGVSCLYDSLSDCNDSENLYPAIGAGAIYVLKEEAGIVLRAEVAKGKSDEGAFYLTMGQPF